MTLWLRQLACDGQSMPDQSSMWPRVKQIFSGGGDVFQKILESPEKVREDRQESSESPEKVRKVRENVRKGRGQVFRNFQKNVEIVEILEKVSKSRNSSKSGEMRKPRNFKKKCEISSKNAFLKVVHFRTLPCRRADLEISTLLSPNFTFLWARNWAFSPAWQLISLW